MIIYGYICYIWFCRYIILQKNGNKHLSAAFPLKAKLIAVHEKGYSTYSKSNLELDTLYCYYTLGSTFSQKQVPKTADVPGTLKLSRN